ncbi:hypothetical protein L3Q82_006648 [Scortum barcoo]|uniref:Uncharacterized protein n=1 Tax=Scortum barcoo TaxID=214431 RepID=A0ACB8WZX4_9TELE|nr:hypothetical protein L3Q82_006648 [Scortum barcoo]
MAVHRCFPSNLMEIERCCKEEWAKLPKDRRYIIHEDEAASTFPPRFTAELVLQSRPRFSLKVLRLIGPSNSDPAS